MQKPTLTLVGPPKRSIIGGNIQVPTNAPTFPALSLKERKKEEGNQSRTDSGSQPIGLSTDTSGP